MYRTEYGHECHKEFIATAVLQQQSVVTSPPKILCQKHFDSKTNPWIKDHLSDSANKCILCTLGIHKVFNCSYSVHREKIWTLLVSDLRLKIIKGKKMHI